MIRPAAFGFNAETASNNHFQSLPTIGTAQQQLLASQEFDAMVEKLRQQGVDVTVIDDTANPPKPDAIFPNNWLSTAPGGKVFMYPMYAPVRRVEKREEIIDYLNNHFQVTGLQDWSEFETEGKFLEGTGSMIIDHDNKLIYACLSERSNPAVLEKFAAANGYQAIVFLATDKTGKPVYHTNVVMALGEKFCVLCEEAIDEEWELIAVKQLLESTGHTIIPITRDQMYSYAGNMLEVKNNKEENILVMSQAFATILGGDDVEAYSAGSRPSGIVNPKAIAAMKELGYDLSKHDSKSLEEVKQYAPFDAVVTMGCGDACPWMPAKQFIDWQIPDPKHMEPPAFNKVRDYIKEKVGTLLNML